MSRPFEFEPTEYVIFLSFGFEAAAADAEGGQEEEGEQGASASPSL